MYLMINTMINMRMNGRTQRKSLYSKNKDDDYDKGGDSKSDTYNTNDKESNNNNNDGNN